MDIKRKLERAMTVEQLMENLQNADPKALVVFVCDYGDYHHTQQALQVRTMDVYAGSDFHESAYSGSGIAINREDDDGGFDEEEDEMDPELEEVEVVVLQQDRRGF